MSSLKNSKLASMWYGAREVKKGKGRIRVLPLSGAGAGRSSLSSSPELLGRSVAGERATGSLLHREPQALTA